jgi:hypothetical protein
MSLQRCAGGSAVIIVVRPRKPLIRGQPGLPLTPGVRRSAIVAQLGRDVALAKYPVTTALAASEKRVAAACAM